jgi:hypothetical protein
MAHQARTAVFALQFATLIAIAAAAKATLPLYRRGSKLDPVATRSANNVVCMSP